MPPIKKITADDLGDALRLSVSGLKPGDEFTLLAVYPSRQVRYEQVGVSHRGELDLRIPRVEPGEVILRLIDETDPDEPKAVAAGSV